MKKVELRNLFIVNCPFMEKDRLAFNRFKIMDYWITILVIFLFLVYIVGRFLSEQFTDVEDPAIGDLFFILIFSTTAITSTLILNTKEKIETNSYVKIGQGLMGYSAEGMLYTEGQVMMWCELLGVCPSRQVFAIKQDGQVFYYSRDSMVAIPAVYNLPLEWRKECGGSWRDDEPRPLRGFTFYPSLPNAVLDKVIVFQSKNNQ